MICHHFKCIFVHIPKTAGQSVEHVFLNLLDLTWDTRAPLLLRYNDRPELGPPRLAHLKAEEYFRCKYLPKEMFDDYFKFTFVRNPWDRMVSFYKYLGFNQRCGFKVFLMDVFRNSPLIEKHWFIRPQSDFVCGNDGNLMVDFVGRFENLQSDFDRICEKINIPQTRLAHVNDSNTNVMLLKDINLGQISQGPTKYEIPKSGIPSFQLYQEYYDNESIDFVAALYERDIENFGYDY